MNQRHFHLLGLFTLALLSPNQAFAGGMKCTPAELLSDDAYAEANTVSQKVNCEGFPAVRGRTLYVAGDQKLNSITVQVTINPLIGKKQNVTVNIANPSDEIRKYCRWKGQMRTRNEPYDIGWRHGEILIGEKAKRELDAALKSKGHSIGYTDSYSATVQSFELPSGTQLISDEGEHYSQETWAVYKKTKEASDAAALERYVAGEKLKKELGAQYNELLNKYVDVAVKELLKRNKNADEDRRKQEASQARKDFNDQWRDPTFRNEILNANQSKIGEKRLVKAN